MGDSAEVNVDVPRNIIKEEIIIPDNPESISEQGMHLNRTSYQINKTKCDEKRQEAFVQKIKEKIHDLDSTKSLNEVQDLVLKNASARIVNTPYTDHMYARIEIESTLRKSNTLEILTPTLSSRSLLKSSLNNPIKIMNPTISSRSLLKSNVMHMKETNKEVAERISSRNKESHYTVCLTCKKLRGRDDSSDKCRICRSMFHYECLRCRDIFPSKREYNKHKKYSEFCLKIDVPPFLSRDSYALASRMEKNQCSESLWYRTLQLISTVRNTRIRLNGGKFNRIKLCCPICETAITENRQFVCMKCNKLSVYKCQLCCKKYKTYHSAIHHTEACISEGILYRCNDCPYVHESKEQLSKHILQKHVPKRCYTKRKNPIPAIACQYCNLLIKKNGYWRKHAYSCRGRVHFKCPFCTEKYIDKEEITSHILVAHHMTHPQVMKVIKDIEEYRNNQEENQTGQNCKTKLYNNRYTTLYCGKCKKTYAHRRVSNDNTCPKCKIHVKVQCKLCKKNFKKYYTAYNHIKNQCAKVKAIKKKQKPDELTNNPEKGRKGQNTQVIDTDINNHTSHSIFGDLTLDSMDTINDKELENNSTISDNDTQFHENDIKLESQDVKVFDGLLNLDNYEVIIPDKCD